MFTVGDKLYLEQVSIELSNQAKIFKNLSAIALNMSQRPTGEGINVGLLEFKDKTFSDLEAFASIWNRLSPDYMITLNRHRRLI